MMHVLPEKIRLRRSRVARHRGRITGAEVDRTNFEHSRAYLDALAAADPETYGAIAPRYLAAEWARMMKNAAEHPAADGTPR